MPESKTGDKTDHAGEESPRLKDARRLIEEARRGGWKRLNLGGHNLTTLPPEIGELTELTELVLDNNQLTTLPETLRKLSNLKILYLHGNPGLNLSSQILGPTWEQVNNGKEVPRSSRKILDYYFANQKRAQMHGAAPLNEAKVIVLGETGVGKTSLILALTENKRKQSPATTHGIAQESWWAPLYAGRLAGKDEAVQETLRLNFWDFGGQDIYHSLHTFFLTRRAVYLLVADARANDRQNNLEYWLRMATSFGAKPPVWIVVNKVDEQGTGPDEHALKRKFPNIRRFLRTSCWTGAGIQKLKEDLVEGALRFDGVQRPMNKVWLNIKHDLEERKTDTLSLQEYHDLCENHGETTPKVRDELLELWDTLGTLRYFPEQPEAPPELRDAVILNPLWVTKAVYAVLDDKIVRNAGGLVTEGDFQRILKDAGFQPDRARMVEQAMRRFDLLYDTREYMPQHKMLVPQQLPQHEPDHDWRPGRNRDFVYRYTTLPPALVPAFIARYHDKLSKNPGPWRHGCVLDHSSGARVRVIADLEQKQITLSVVMGDPMAARDALDCVRTDFEDLHAAVPGLEVEEFILVPNDDDTGASLVSYGILRVLELNGVSELRTRNRASDKFSTINAGEILQAVRSEKRAESEKLEVNIHFHGDDAKVDFSTTNFRGTFQGVAAGKIEGGSIVINQQRKRLLKDVKREARALISRLPADKQEEAAESLERLIKEATAKKPSRKWYSVSAEGLLEASKFVKDLSGNIVDTVATPIEKLGKLLWPGFKLGGG